MAVDCAVIRATLLMAIVRARLQAADRAAAERASAPWNDRWRVSRQTRVYARAEGFDTPPTSAVLPASCRAAAPSAICIARAPHVSVQASVATMIASVAAGAAARRGASSD